MSVTERVKIIRLFLLLAICAGAIWLCYPALTMAKQLATVKMTQKKFTVEDRLEQFAPTAEARLQPFLRKAQIAWPPKQIVLVGLKQERLLELYLAGDDGKYKFIRSYPFTAFSGTLGPKLKEGDGQIPEGIYGIDSLNPNSLYHLSLRVGYPNEFDRRMGKKDGREQLGGDIMIHGRSVTIGCIPVGDPAIEELFVLSARAGVKNIKVIISPVDFRKAKLPADMPETPVWTDELYKQIARELDQFRH